ILWDRAAPEPPRQARRRAPPRRLLAGSERGSGADRRRTLQRALDLLDGHHSAQDAGGVDRHQGAEGRETLRAEQGLERLVDADAERLAALDRGDLVDVRARSKRLRNRLHPVAARESQEAASDVRDGEPIPSVAHEIVVERAIELQRRRQDY